MIEPGKMLPSQDELSGHASRTRPWQLKYSVSQITTCRSSLEIDLAAWREAGLESIGLWRRKLDDYGLAEAAELVRDSGLAVSSLSFAGGFTNMECAYKDAISDAVEAVFTAAAVGARTLVIAPGEKARYTPNNMRRLVADAIRDVSFTAAELGIELCVLPLARPFAGRWSMLHSLDETACLLATVDRPNVSIAFDTFHFCRSQQDLSDLSEFLPQVGLIQLSDSVAKPVSEYDRCLPGQGLLPLSDLMRLLEAERFQGLVDLQVWSDLLWDLEPASILRDCQHSMSELLSGRHIDRARNADESARVVIELP